MKLKFFVLFIFYVSVQAWAHGPEKHNDGKSKDMSGKEALKEPTEVQIKKINAFYIKTIKPIFKRKCLNCHGNAEKLPWYASVPGSKQLVEHDIEEAKEHMDMSQDIPFSGHGNLKEDLESLTKTIDKGSMPPWQYMLMHWKSGLDKNEKTTIKKWIKESQKILTESK